VALLFGYGQLYYWFRRVAAFTDCLSIVASDQISPRLRNGVRGGEAGSEDCVSEASGIFNGTASLLELLST
jgi:hypothetical protein